MAGGGGGSFSIINSPVSMLQRDTFSIVPFSVPITSTVPVSGGGGALQTAIAAAGPGTNLVIQDSLSYSQVTIGGKTNLMISAAPLQTPSITAAAGPGQHAIRLDAGNSGIKIVGLTLIGNGNGNSGAQQIDGIVNGAAAGGGTMASIDRVIIDSCTFGELVPTNGAPAIQLLGTDGTMHTNVWITKCVAIDCGSASNTSSAGYACIEVSGFTGVWIQNSKVGRSVIARASSNMRGFGWKSINVTVEDCFADDIGTGGANEAFKHHEEAVFGTAVGDSSVRNCVAYNCKRGYRITLTAATMTVNESICYNDTAGIAAGQIFVRQDAGTMVFENGVIEGAGDGTAFSATVTENNNDIFNVAAPGKALDATDQTVDPDLQSPSTNVYVAEAPTLQTAGSDGGPMGIRYAEPVIWAGV
jgi:hypothetical protein